METSSNNSLISLDLALDRLREALLPITESDWLPLEYVLGRTLATPIVAPINVPPSDNSAMDGYAVHVDIAAAPGSTWTLVGKALAGTPWQGRLQPNECIRITTGAMLPDGANTVAIQEDVTLEQDRIILNETLVQGEHMRPAGDDIQQGAIVLAAGKTLGVADIGMLAALGIAEVEVIRPLRIALFSTGDELKEPGSTLKPGQIYESNRIMLTHLLKSLPIELTDLGILADDPALLRETFLAAADSHDIVISTGGVSVGDADYTHEILQEIGEIAFWKLAIKPGKPVAFGRLNEAWFFGLPGNPVSALVTAHHIILPALRYMSGQPWKEPFQIKAVSTKNFYKRPGRQDFQRALLTRNHQGDWEVEPTDGQGSHMLLSFSKANAYAVLPAASGDIPIGSMVTVIPFGAELTG
ncbi:gephyrin-like molybdotransferase Glp [Salinispirillum marinum]|uniref:Molybdopterin molybdenumtransferase n=2 Tax=Saccharospirillaceae TaxID=255527 RepID=A0ABV8BAT2_9GAMM